MNDQKQHEIPEGISFRNQKENEYCFGYYAEIQKDIEFKKNNLPFDQYEKYIRDNLTKFVNHIENCERDQRAGNLNTNGLMVLKSYHITLPLWKTAFDELKQSVTINPAAGQLDKIKWKGSPAVFGYLFIELVKKGFIEPPLHNGEPNFSGLSRLCFQYFDIETTPGNLYKEMIPGVPEKGTDKNTLSLTKRAKFTIPDISDLA